MKSFIASLLFLFSFNALALQQYQSSDFNEISQKIYDLGQQLGPANVLVVYDLDNTLLAMVKDIGSDQWFDWQSALLKTPEAPNLVAKDFDGLLKVQGTLYNLGIMRLTQAEVPSIYANIASLGFRQILLTSRGPDFRDATEREILRNKIPVWSVAQNQNTSAGLPYDLNDLGKSCLTEEDRVKFKLGTPRSVSTGKNMILSSGQHKGMILKAWLCANKYSFKAIVFADDKQSNINNMAAAFGDSTTTELVTYRYTREDSRVEEFTNGEKKQAILDWQILSAALNSVFGTLP